MKVLLQLRLMYLAISKEKGRMALVVLMVAIGICSVMVLVSLSKGTQAQVALTLQKEGYNLLTISPSQLQALPGRGGQWYLAQTLREKDVQDLRQQLPEIELIEPISEELLTIKYEDNDIRTSVKGVSKHFQVLRNLEMDTGRPLIEKDLRHKTKVAVVGSFISQKLNDGNSLVGQKLLINRTVFSVVGELKEKGMSSAGTNYDDLILVPFDTANVSLWNKDYVDRVLVRYKDGVDVDGLIAEISDILRVNHHIYPDQKSDFEVFLQTQSNAAKEVADSLIAGLAVFFTAVTLVAGGIGVLAVSYLNILDRKAEVGLRMALGATRNSVAVMIILEAILLCSFGGIIGTLSGIFLISLIKFITEWYLQVDVMVILLPFVISISLGAIFGFIPARVASNMVPAQTLKLD